MNERIFIIHLEHVEAQKNYKGLSIFKWIRKQGKNGFFHNSQQPTKKNRSLS